MSALYLDTETTGLSSYDELVELALIDDQGAVLMDTLVRPVTVTSWIDAQRIHGISPEMVVKAPTLEELLPKLCELASGRELVIYNAGYDLQYLPGVRERAASVHCAMESFAEYWGDWNDYHQSFRWQRLGVAAQHVGHVWSGDMHRARADALACRSVWRFLLRHCFACRTELMPDHQVCFSDECVRRRAEAAQL